MPKRKRGDGERDDEDPPASENLPLAAQVSKLKGTLHQGTARLHAALKLARGFERQKLGRRQKAAGAAPQDLLRLREEVIVLKQMQLDQTARNHLVKQLAKTKRFKEHPAVIRLYGPAPAFYSPGSTAEANLVGRLFNANPVKQLIPSVMKGIYDALGLSPPHTTVLVRNGSVEHGAAQEARPTTNELASHDAVDDDIASSLFDSEDGSDLGVRPPVSDRPVASSEGSASRSPSPALDPNATRRRRGDPKPLSTTAFLPSLSMGGYYSGSESDADDGHGEVDLDQPPVRKNRRGQRARQQLAEKKYGQNARHLANPKKTGQPANGARWDARQGAVSQDRSRRATEWSRKGQTSEPPAANSERSAPKKREAKRDDTGTLHPSWIAAKQRKEQTQVQAAFAGKRTTFD